MRKERRGKRGGGKRGGDVFCLRNYHLAWSDKSAMPCMAPRTKEGGGKKKKRETLCRDLLGDGRRFGERGKEEKRGEGEDFDLGVEHRRGGCDWRSERGKKKGEKGGERASDDFGEPSTEVKLSGPLGRGARRARGKKSRRRFLSVGRFPSAVAKGRKKKKEKRGKKRRRLSSPPNRGVETSRRIP